MSKIKNLYGIITPKFKSLKILLVGKKKKKRQQSKVIAFKRMTSHKQTKLNAHMKGNKSDVSNLKLTLSLNKKDSLQRQFNSLGQQNYKVLDKVYGKLNSYLSLQYPEWDTLNEKQVRI